MPQGNEKSASNSAPNDVKYAAAHQNAARQRQNAANEAPCRKAKEERELRIADKLYGELVLKNRSVAYEYRRYKERHYQLHRRFRPLSWAYLLWLLCKYRLLRQDKRLRLHYPESEAAVYPQEKALLRKCEGAEVVSLNVFDTLLLRKVTDAGFVYDAVGDILGINDYREQRRRASEEAARRAGGPAGLANICAVIEEWSGVSATSAHEAELYQEEKFCIGNPYLIDVIEKLQKRGKRIVAVSNSDLPSSFLKELLAENGISVERVFVGHEYGKATEHGLFEDIKAELHTDKIVHIGDDARHDSAAAKQAGLRSVLVPNLHTECGIYRPQESGSAAASVTAALTNIRLHAEGKTPGGFYEHGYAYGGPMVYGFCGWLQELAQKKKYDCFLFLARDAEIVCEMYRKYFSGIAGVYLPISRYGSLKLAFPQYFLQWYEAMFAAKANKKRKIAVEEGLCQAEIGFLAEKLPASLRGRVLDKAAAEALLPFLAENKEKIAAVYAKDAAAFGKYILPRLAGHRRVCIVDIGWRGTIYTMLESYFRSQNIDIYVGGAMLGTTKSDMAVFLSDRGKIDSYLFSHNKNADKQIAESEVMLLETLFSSDGPCTVGYAEKEGEAFPVYGAAEDAGNFAYAQMRRGIKDFCKAFAEAKRAFPYPLHMAGADAFAPIGQIDRNKKYNLKLFGKCRMSEDPNGAPQRVSELLREAGYR